MLATPVLRENSPPSTTPASARCAQQGSLPANPGAPSVPRVHRARSLTRAGPMLATPVLRENSPRMTTPARASCVGRAFSLPKAGAWSVPRVHRARFPAQTGHTFAPIARQENSPRMTTPARASCVGRAFSLPKAGAWSVPRVHRARFPAQTGHTFAPIARQENSPPTTTPPSAHCVQQASSPPNLGAPSVPRVHRAPFLAQTEHKPAPPAPRENSPPITAPARASRAKPANSSGSPGKPPARPASGTSPTTTSASGAI